MQRYRDRACHCGAECSEALDNRCLICALVLLLLLLAYSIDARFCRSLAAVLSCLRRKLTPWEPILADDDTVNCADMLRTAVEQRAFSIYPGE